MAERLIGDKELNDAFQAPRTGNWNKHRGANSSLIEYFWVIVVAAMIMK